MKYIITEQQEKRLEKSIHNSKLGEVIVRYFNTNLLPYEGWQNIKSYKEELKENGGELYFFLVESDGDGDKEHMWYSICDNQNISDPFPKGTCPFVALPKDKYDSLQTYFNDRWKPFFITWFKTNTELPLLNVDSLEW